jgi:hypothetical protein
MVEAPQANVTTQCPFGQEISRQVFPAFGMTRELPHSTHPAPITVTGWLRCARQRTYLRP